MISKANLEDISGLNSLINSAYRGETSKIGWTTEANILEGIRTSEKELLEIIQEPNTSIFKFVENQKTIGCVLLVKKENKLYLGMLTVSPELQNSGIGKKLLKFAEDYAFELSLSKIVMTVISVREELIAWYKRHGYLDTGKREPFPMDNPEFGLPKQKLEFIVLQKLIP
ncbi:GNAT family N-acetyltransferase [Flavobacterium sp.]|uniref:GNAT family N-acetyltransferase n=1 Tax=Flavobacterium sp. TaxID=239 RepID=UPI00286E1DD4|nr:GNAT family N-acetyltransferase [Flavobacterium sp.]